MAVTLGYGGGVLIHKPQGNNVALTVGDLRRGVRIHGP